MGTIGALIVTLIINIAGGVGFSALFSSPPPSQPREEQSVSRENQEADALPNTVSDEARPNETPSAEER